MAKQKKLLENYKKSIYEVQSLVPHSQLDLETKKRIDHYLSAFPHAFEHLDHVIKDELKYA